MTTRESVLAALFSRLEVTGLTVLRNDPLPARVPPAGLVILRDGDPGEPEVTLSPLRYHWHHHADVELVTQGADRNEVFDAACSLIGAAIAADRRLGGLCDWIECGAPEPQDIAVDGAAPIKAAIIACTLHYSSADALA